MPAAGSSWSGWAPEAQAPVGDQGAPTADDVAMFLHTSGTTSRPKGVPLRHRNLVASLANIAATYNLGPADVSLLRHARSSTRMAWSLRRCSTLRSGGTVVVPPRFNPLGFWPVAKEHRATWYSAVPTIHQLLVARARGRASGRRGSETLRFDPLVQLGALARILMQQLESHFAARRAWRPTA